MYDSYINREVMVPATRVISALYEPPCLTTDDELTLPSLKDIGFSQRKHFPPPKAHSMGAENVGHPGKGVTLANLPNVSWGTVRS